MNYDQNLGRIRRRRRGWYMLSVDALRAWGIVIGLVVLAGVGYLVHREWRFYTQQREAAAAIAEAESLVMRLQATAGVFSHDRYGADFANGRTHLLLARRAYERREVAEAHREGLVARNMLLLILNQVERRGDAGEANFIRMHGDVEYRRGESGEWQSARLRVSLASGDYVRTGANGSAEIMFADGTLYTVRPNTSFIVARSRGSGDSEQSITMEYGWVNLNTASRAARVATPSAEARVREDSEAFVSYEQETKRGRFGAFRGTVDVAAGEVKKRLSALEEVVQVGEKLAEPHALPGPTEPVEPPDNAQLDPARQPQVVLGWRPVDGASRYALQVSRNHSFVDNIIDVDDRSRPRATLGLQGEGSFLWRVRAIGRDGSAGPWSAAHSFRVAASAVGDGERSDGGDDVPPDLELEDVSSYGNIFIIGGRTEAGATVEIDGELVKVSADGSFTKTIQLNKEGWNIIEVRARDAWGNEAKHYRRVFVDAP